MSGDRQASPEAQMEVKLAASIDRAKGMMGNLEDVDFASDEECKGAMAGLYRFVRTHNKEVVPHVSQQKLGANRLKEDRVHVVNFTVDGSRVELQLATVGDTPLLHVAPTIRLKKGFEGPRLDIVPAEVVARNQEAHEGGEVVEMSKKEKNADDEKPMAA